MSGVCRFSESCLLPANVHPSCPAETNTGCPATCSSYRINKVDPLPMLRVSTALEYSLQIQVEIFKLQPNKPSKELAKLVMFMALIGHCYPKHLDDFPQELKDPLSYNYTVLNADLPITFCNALISGEESHQSIKFAIALLWTSPCKFLRLNTLILWLIRIKVQNTIIKWIKYYRISCAH